MTYDTVDFASIYCGSGTNPTRLSMLVPERKVWVDQSGQVQSCIVTSIAMPVINGVKPKLSPIALHWPKPGLPETRTTTRRYTLPPRLPWWPLAVLVGVLVALAGAKAFQLFPA